MDDKVGAFLTGFSTLASYRFGFIAEASILAVPSSFRYPPVLRKSRNTSLPVNGSGGIP